MIDFIIGVVASVAAAALVFFFKYLYARYQIRGLRGIWLQIKPSNAHNPDHICVLEITYSLRHLSYKARGKVFDASGNLSATWASLYCTIDQDRRRIFYSYSGHGTRSLFQIHEGFGSIIMEGTDQSLSLNYGYFMDASFDTAPQVVQYIKAGTHTQPFTRTLSSFSKEDFTNVCKNQRVEICQAKTDRDSEEYAAILRATVETNESEQVGTSNGG